MRLVANPQYYDYLHCIVIDGYDSKLLDGGGQCINLEVEGSIMADDSEMTFDFEDFTFSVPYRIETRSCTEPPWPNNTIHRFVFEKDPIAIFCDLLRENEEEKDLNPNPEHSHSNRDNNLFFLLERVTNEHIYYALDVDRFD